MRYAKCDHWAPLSDVGEIEKECDGHTIIVRQVDGTSEIFINVVFAVYAGFRIWPFEDG